MKNTTVKPTLIQRNEMDMATELTLRYFEQYEIQDLDHMREVFLKFFATAKMANKVHFRYIKNYLPEDMKQNADRFR